MGIVVLKRDVELVFAVATVAHIGYLRFPVAGKTHLRPLVVDGNLALEGRGETVGHALVVEAEDEVKSLLELEAQLVVAVAHLVALVGKGGYLAAVGCLHGTAQMGVLAPCASVGLEGYGRGQHELLAGVLETVLDDCAYLYLGGKLPVGRCDGIALGHHDQRHHQKPQCGNSSFFHELVVLCKSGYKYSYGTKLDKKLELRDAFCQEID